MILPPPGMVLEQDVTTNNNMDMDLVFSIFCCFKESLPDLSDLTPSSTSPRNQALEKALDTWKSCLDFASASPSKGIAQVRFYIADLEERQDISLELDVQQILLDNVTVSILWDISMLPL